MCAECCGVEPRVLLVFGVPGQLQSLAGQEHGRTIPIADVANAEAALRDYELGCRVWYLFRSKLSWRLSSPTFECVSERADLAVSQ